MLRNPSTKYRPFSPIDLSDRTWPNRSIDAPPACATTLTTPGVVRTRAQAVRQIRFTDVQEIVEMEAVLKSYIQEAIEIEKAGLKVQKNPRLMIPEEFQNKLDETPALKTAFEALTPGRRRVYIMHFSQPKHPRLESRELKNAYRKFSTARDWMTITVR